MLRRLDFWRLREMLGIDADAFVVLTNEKTGAVRVIPGRNLVTDEGDKYYAQSACGETPTKTFANLYLATSGPDPVLKTTDYDDFGGITGEKAPTATYPKTNDGDSDNTGAGVDVISWKYEYTTSDGPFTDITHSFISVASAGAGEAILNGYKWAAAWSKDAATSAKIFANHTVNGT
jgi:hypothetical protein